jgi:hypothetical protein
MAFFASLFAYIFAVGGIVLAMAMSYAVLLAPPAEQPPSPSSAVAAIVHQSSAQASNSPSVKAQAPSARDASRLAQAEPTRKSRAAARRAVAANEVARQRRAGPPGAGAYAGLWAFQRPPDRGGWHFGYAEEEANEFNRGW